MLRSVMMGMMADQRPTISTHVLDLASGNPARGVVVRLERLADDGHEQAISELRTDDDGRIRDLLPSTELRPGDYRLTLAVGRYAGEETGFFRELSVALRIFDTGRSYHVPLLLSPFGMSTYRGS
ncbi:MAG: hydroxyisourate hydrolase [Chloroflexota bacterium]|nr:hydroxyisourate hydrolase [Chloroflexota bacterium]